MVERGYYKHYEGGIYYVITIAIKVNDNNTQDKVIVYKPIDSDMIFVKNIDNFESFVEIDGERLKRFKRVNDDFPTWPPTASSYPYDPTAVFIPYNKLL